MMSDAGFWIMKTKCPKLYNGSEKQVVNPRYSKLKN
jgi:hypothetical protein